MGLTQSVGGEGLRFEVWVRQAPRTRDCVTLQAKDREDKAAWTRDVAHLLWTHAINNTGSELDSIYSLNDRGRPKEREEGSVSLSLCRGTPLVSSLLLSFLFSRSGRPGLRNEF
ncbi:Puratrophin-1 [Liparis tanakae]|uniref:Puratrophin-1 n=1 Tax=Liparis tanakae TaxID=230148 RepID=A0A4Z2E971_9TELE|nr:Puratrophin-1 [Liparis tanakae]